MARKARTGSPASDPPATRALAAGRRPQPSRNRSGDWLDFTNGGAADVARKEPTAGGRVREAGVLLLGWAAAPLRSFLRTLASGAGACRLRARRFCPRSG